jgi:sulfoxide reductase heme-binding subunit YedZ
MTPVQIRLLLVALLAVPALNLFWQIAQVLQGLPNDLGPDPGKGIVVELGQYSLWLLLLVFSATPLRLWLGWRWLTVHRRVFGVAVFCYYGLHITAYVVFLLELHFSEVLEDVLQRPYITMGMLSAVLLMPLAWTSNDYSVRRLGRNWKRLHRLIYPAILFVMIHVIWMARSDLLQPLLYLLVVLLCFAGRSQGLLRWVKGR